MKKTIVIVTLVIVISILLGLGSSALSGNKAQGQCAYHGGLDKETGKCKDGTSAGAYEAAEKPKKPIPASYLKYHNAAVSKIESLSDKKELCETEKCNLKIDKQIQAEQLKVEHWCRRIITYDGNFMCGMQ